MMIVKMFGARRIAALERQLDELRVEFSTLRSTVVALERQVEWQARDAGELATGLMAQLARSKLHRDT